MRQTVLIALSVGLVVGFGIAWGQEEKEEKEEKEAPEANVEERKTSAEVPPVTFPPKPDDIWNFHFHGKKKRGEVLEFLEKEDKQRFLVITHFELRTRHSTRVQIIEHRKKKKKKRSGGGTHWVNEVRRSELFSLGWQDATSKYIASGFSTLVGMKFEPGMRPGVEITFGGGEMAVYAEGYWARR